LFPSGSVTLKTGGEKKLEIINFSYFNRRVKLEKKEKRKRSVEKRKRSITIHKPTTIRRYVSFGYDEVQISKDLYNFKKYSMFVSTINL
jgi:hypothetical protein